MRVTFGGLSQDGKEKEEKKGEEGRVQVGEC
jgi:hypothetical protein